MASAAGAWARVEPPVAPGATLEEVIIGAQWRRSARIPESDVLLVGDSSGLFDVDAWYLSELLGVRVQGLATIGVAGPRSFLRLLERYADRFEARPIVVLMLHPMTVSMSGDDENFKYFEALGVDPTIRGSFLEAGRDKLYSELFLRWVDLPLRSDAGFYYGSATDLRFALDTWNGTLEEPSARMSDAVEREVRDLRYGLSPAYRSRLREFAEGLRKRGFETVRLVLTPVPESFVGPPTEMTRQRLSAALRESLRLEREAILPLPSTLPTGHFSTPTHLRPSARPAYTRRLAEALGARNARHR
ncbi:MAG: hypothetical protein AAFU79_21230 [Myxococcota bacterium]